MNIRGVDYDDIWVTVDNFEQDVLISWQLYRADNGLNLPDIEGIFNRDVYAYGFMDPFGSGNWISDVCNEKPTDEFLMNKLQKYIFDHIL